MLLQTVLALALVLLLAAGCSHPPDPGRLAAPATRPVSLEEIRERGVAGRLGRPLGTIIRVSGGVVENASEAKADAGQPFLIRIDSVDGMLLPLPVIFPAADVLRSQEQATLKVGDRFTATGYERGGFRGSPAGEFDYVQPYATYGFHFHTEFVVLKAE